MTNREAKELMEKFRAGTCTEAEEALLKAWYRSLADAGRTPPPPEIEKALKEISRSLPLERNTRDYKLSFRRIAAAVLVLFAFTAGIYFLSENRPVSHFSGNIYKNDVAPGGNKAVLELADGSLIDLSSASLGDLSRKKSFRITKTSEGRVVYEAAGLATGAEPTYKDQSPVYNTIKTPRGGQFQVILPDGSGAWLNAASSIRFPAIFTEGERRVEITGEVYFEVAGKYRPSDSGKVRVPFVVVAGEQQIAAIGTQFNVNAYPDEGPVRTTLLEGRVEVSLPASRVWETLEPGQQAQLADARSFKVAPANMERVFAWKNGQFRYNMDDIEYIMRQVERWYDVEVIYEGKVPDEKFVGTISRKISLSGFLDILSYTGINFRIEGRRIFVMS